MNRAIPVADHVAIRSVQIWFTLGNIFKKVQWLEKEWQIIDKEQQENISRKKLMFFQSRGRVFDWQYTFPSTNLV